MSKHLFKTLLALLCFGIIGVFGVWITHTIESDKTGSKEKGDISAVVDSVLKRISN